MATPATRLGASRVVVRANLNPLVRADGCGRWLVWRDRVFNALWTWIFFAWRSGALALMEILVLWVLILRTLAAFWRVRPLAGALLIPCLAWVTFSAPLTCFVWPRNPGLLA